MSNIRYAKQRLIINSWHCNYLITAKVLKISARITFKSPTHFTLYWLLNLLLQLKESVNEHLFPDKIILWRKMAKIWLKIWLKVKENGTKKIKLAKMVAKEKEILVRTLKNWLDFGGLDLIFKVTAVEKLKIYGRGTSVFSENTVTSVILSWDHAVIAHLAEFKIPLFIFCISVWAGFELIGW